MKKIQHLIAARVAPAAKLVITISTLALLLLLVSAIDSLKPRFTARTATLPTNTINFDATIYPPGTRITNQYEGVIFPEGGIIASASALGTSTQSAPNLLRKDCRGIGGIDLGSFKVQFTAPQGRVRVYVGNPSPLAQKATLHAYDALTGGTLVATTETNLGANAPVTTPLEISRAINRDIRLVEVEVSGAVCEVIDNLLFDPDPLAGAITTVNFDDRAPSTQISTQYPGVIFPGTSRRSGSPALPVVRTASSLNTTTVSPPNVLEQQINDEDEFDIRPLTVQFTNPQAWVRIYTGLPPSSGSRTVQLLAYSSLSGGAPVATAQVTFPGNAPVNSPLEISRFEQRDIRRVEIQRVDLVAVGNSSGLEVIDNLQFAGSAPPPPPPDTEAPRVFIDSPPNNGFFFEPAQFVYPVRGRITENRALERVRVTVEQIGGAGRFELENIQDTSTGAVTGSAPNFSFSTQVRFFPGRNRLRVEATDTAGNRSTNAEQEVIVTLAPTVEVLIDSPRPDQVFTQRTVTVTGRVRKQLGALTREQLRIRVQPPGAPRTFASVDVIEGAAPEFRFRATVSLIKEFAITDAVNPIEVQATLEDGRVVTATVRVFFSEPDVGVAATQVTQATGTRAELDVVSGAGSTLVAFKRTVLRVYPKAERWRAGNLVILRQVTVRGRRGGVLLPGSPLVINQPMIVIPDTSLDTLQRDGARTWNVVLPNDWTQPGEVTLEVEINSDRAVAECDLCINNNLTARYNVRFQASNRLRIVPVIIDRGDGRSVTDAEIPQAFEAIRRTYPLTTLELLPKRVSRTNATGGDLTAEMNASFVIGCVAGSSIFGPFYSLFGGCSWDTVFVGLVRDPVPLGGGLVLDGQAVPSLPSAWAVPKPRTVAHEVAHCFGRSHAGNSHGEGGGGGFDGSFPYEHGGIGEVGFDTVELLAISPHSPFQRERPGTSLPLGNGSDHAHDYMSYGAGPWWISPYTYQALYNTGFRGGVRGLFRGDPPVDEPAEAAAGALASFVLSQTANYLFVSGEIAATGEIRLHPFYVHALQAGTSLIHASGPYLIELQNRGGQPLYSGRFDLLESTFHTSERLFSAIAPLPAGTARVLIKEGDRVLATRDVSSAAPIVHLLSPNGGEVWPASGTQRITWSGADANGDALTFALQQTSDNGQTWEMLASNLRGTSYDLDVSWLKGGSEAKIRVIATDGVNTSQDESDQVFSIPRKAPSVMIFAPQNGAVLNLSQLLAFEGTASDYEDPSLPETSLTWTSDRDGALGAGRRVDVTRLSTGVHNISLAAKDSDGQVGRTSVNVLVPGSSAAHVSAASFAQTSLASEMIVSAFGSELATDVAIANSLPLPTVLAGTRAIVRDRNGKEYAVPLFFVAPSQINYLMPAGLPAGAATITITNEKGKATISPLLIGPVAPGLFAANANGLGVPAASLLRVSASGAQSYEQIAQFDQQQNQFIPRPIDLGPESDQIFLILFGTGLRQRSALSNVQALIGGANAEVLYAGVSPGFEGLDQINLRVPRSLAGRGQVDVGLTVDGKSTNPVTITFK